MCLLQIHFEPRRQHLFHCLDILPNCCQQPAPLPALQVLQAFQDILYRADGIVRFSRHKTRVRVQRSLLDTEILEAIRGRSFHPGSHDLDVDNIRSSVVGVGNAPKMMLQEDSGAFDAAGRLAWGTVSLQILPSHATYPVLQSRPVPDLDGLFLCCPVRGSRKH